jgi:hypothetical protein
MIFLPAPSILFYTQIFLTLAFGVFVFYLESTGKFNLPYSKFASNSGISPRLGMFLIYFIPILGYLSTIPNFKTISPYHLLLLLVFTFHFTKRCLEVLFLHIFSGKIGLVGVVFITLAYTNIGILLGNNHAKMQALAELSPGSAYSLFALFLFIFGQSGNFYHHLLLKKLREKQTDKVYSMPTGGLFPFVVCPHYFFELLSWFAIALLSTHWESYVVFFIMLCYLSGRSERTKSWYHSKFIDFPRERKRILPFVY